ncbi:MAG: alpha-glucosidase C-terminal domain-containing protein, partial [Mesorhizobium sp.]|nr:alpha-glucosidase C-terminal domain-containing protein [Mesorhizobium sp.]
AVDVENGEDHSVLSAYRSVLALRKRHPALTIGSIRFLEAEGDVLAFIREGDGEKLVCVFNFAGDQAAWTLPPELADVELVALEIDSSGVLAGVLEEATLALPPLGCFIGRVA